MEAVTILQPSDERPTKDAFERCLTLALSLASPLVRSRGLSRRHRRRNFHLELAWLI
jgi:hypothetical protein